MFAFLGDTTVQFFTEQQEKEEKGEDSIFRYPLIITECTFLGNDDKDEERAANTKHVFWPHLKPIIERHQDIIFVLIHFSHRNSESTIRDFFQKENLRNVVPFIESLDAKVIQHNSTIELDED